MNKVDAQGVMRRREGFERETDYRFAAFCSWCAHLTGKRVAVYGSGANAQRIIAFADLPFELVAVVDDKQPGKVCANVHAVTLCEALDMGIDALILAAEFKSAIIAYHRVRACCKSAGVPVFDMYGNDYAKLYEQMRFRCDARGDNGYAALDACLALLVNLDVLNPQDRSASGVARVDARDAALARKAASIIEFALAQGKQVVYFVNDSSVSVEAATKQLEAYGLDGTGFLALPGEMQLWPENGLFRAVCDALATDNVVILGNNVYIDCFIPLVYGKESMPIGELFAPLFFSVEEPLREVSFESSWCTEAKLVDCRSSYEGAPCAPGLSVAEGSPENKLRQSALSCMPIVRTRIGADAAQLVEVIGPLVIGYVTWLANQLAHAPKSYDGVLFASRDGRVIQRVYDICRANCVDGNLPPSHYFYTSRLASMAAAQTDQLGKARFHTMEYLASSGLKAGGSYAFVEFVGGGTCQLNLAQFVPFELDCFYFGSRVGWLLAHNYDAKVYLDEHDASFVARYLQIEPFMSSEEPSLVGFGEHGAPVFADEHRSLEEIALMNAVHEGICELARRYFAQSYEPFEVLDHRFVNAIMPALDLCGTDALTLYNDMQGDMMLSKDFMRAVFEEEPLQLGRASELASSAPAFDSSTREGRASRSVHDVLLGLLGAFDEVCRAFDLTYVATHGTLLGAVRHQGFVPWDDDLDVAMPRKDYDMLLTLASAGVFPEPFFLQTPENDPSCFYGGYAKLRDSSTAALEEGAVHRGSNQGIWMDIMPLDNCPLNEEAVYRRRKLVRIWQRALYAKTYGIFRLWDSDPYKVSAYYALGDKMSRASLCRHLKKACSAVEDTGELTVFAGNYLGSMRGVRFKSADVRACVRVPFERMTVPIPQHATEWLADYYGENWESITSDQAQRRVHKVTYDPNRSYRDLIDLLEDDDS